MTQGNGADGGKAKPAAEVETVTLTDGRVVEFPGKKKMIKESIVDGERLGVRLDFRNGETRTFWLPQALIPKFATHGAEQKYGDETAGLEDVGDMVEAVDELDGRIQKGEWSVKRESSGLAGTSTLIQALVAYFTSLGKPKTVEQVRAQLQGKSQAEKLALRANVKVKPFVDQIEAAKATKGGVKIDSDAELAAMEASV